MVSHMKEFFEGERILKQSFTPWVSGYRNVIEMTAINISLVYNVIGIV
jgi:hypothetical protein